MSNLRKKIISVLVPVYNEELNIKTFYNRLSKVLAKVRKKYDYEIIFTNNCSEDNTVFEISKIIKNDKNVKVISLSKNFGRNNSQLAGLENSIGDILFMIDVDCEDPPEMLLKFLDYYEKGFDLVYGIRSRIKESLFLYLSAKIFYRVTRLFADQELILDMAEFSIFSAQIKKEILKTKTSFPFFRAELSSVGFEKKGISYVRKKRLAGKSNYSFLKLLEFAAAGFFTSSSFFLRGNALIGFFTVFINFLFLILYSFGLVINIELVILLNSIIILFSISFISLYVGRIHTNNLNRPKYIIDYNKSLNFK